MKNKKITKLCIFVVVMLVFILCLILYNFIKPYYFVSNRVDKVRELTDYPTYGWIKVQGTNIDYPVLYAQADDFNINDVDISFAWTNSSSRKLNNRVVILGHNIRNVSSKPLLNQKEFNNFENLPSYLYYDFVKENKYIQYTINNKNYLYKIYAVSMLDGYDFEYAEDMDTEQREKYIESVKKDSYFDFDIDVNSSDKLITLTTCTRFFGNTSTVISVDGRLVRDGEKKKNYAVSKKKNYSKIEKTIKGDGSNEKA